MQLLDRRACDAMQMFVVAWYCTNADTGTGRSDVSHIILRCRRHRTADIRFRGDVRCAEILICQPLYTE